MTSIGSRGVTSTVYRNGDPEPAEHVVVLTEFGWVAQREGMWWRAGPNARYTWAQLVEADMVVVGVDLPAHPDPLATSPQTFSGPQEQAARPAARTGTYLAGEPLSMGGVVTVPPLSSHPGAVDVQLPMFPDGGDTA